MSESGVLNVMDLVAEERCWRFKSATGPVSNDLCTRKCLDQVEVDLSPKIAKIYVGLETELECIHLKLATSTANKSFSAFNMKAVSKCIQMDVLLVRILWHGVLYCILPVFV